MRRQGLLLSVGARTAQQLRDNLGALSLQLSDDQLARLEEASAISAGYPHDFLGQRRAMFEPDALPSMTGALQSTGGR
ncbi:hypothetical protein NJ76_27485 [Rhodococcus sp. IITR03]|nr:hypothetical protein NJ76_27485 [Rhodococcus sp. IITR03]